MTETISYVYFEKSDALIKRDGSMKYTYVKHVTMNPPQFGYYNHLAMSDKAWEEVGDREVVWRKNRDRSIADHSLTADELKEFLWVKMSAVSI